MEVIDGMQVVMEAGFGHLFGAKTAAVVEYSLANSVIPYRHGGPIRENEGWPKRDPGARIVSAHDRRHVVAADEQAWNRFAHFGQYPAIGVGLQTLGRAGATK